MKKITLILLTAMIISGSIGISGCGNESDTNDNPNVSTYGNESSNDTDTANPVINDTTGYQHRGENDDYEYKVYDTYVEITKYKGSGTDVTVPSEIEKLPVTAIGRIAFSGCQSLTSITIPDNVTFIDSLAFSECSSLSDITIPENNISIEANAFYHTPWYTEQADGLVYLGKCLYSYKGNMPENTNITLKEGTTCISGNAFSNCSTLTGITIPDSVTFIGTDAFSGCTALSSAAIPDSVTEIGENAFNGCSALANVNIPDGITSIKKYTFNACEALTSINIPDSVTEIGESAFNGCSSLKSVTIPNGVIIIGDMAFSGCFSLERITIPESVTMIAGYPFSFCRNLTIYGKSGSSIEKYANKENIPFVVE